jgi:hypothetical protein
MTKTTDDPIWFNSGTPSDHLFILFFESARSICDHVSADTYDLRFAREPGRKCKHCVATLEAVKTGKTRRRWRLIRRITLNPRKRS